MIQTFRLKEKMGRCCACGNKAKFAITIAKPGDKKPSTAGFCRNCFMSLRGQLNAVTKADGVEPN